VVIVRIHNNRSGQALIEGALMVPLLLLILLNAVNVGYFYWAVINLSEATRGSAEWSIMGTASTLGKQAPPSGPLSDGTSVAFLAFQDISAFASSSNATVTVCTTTFSTGTPITTCNPYGATTTFTPTADADPEGLVLNRVDIVYQFTPLIGSGWIGVWSPPSTIHRYVEMRALN
jgi:Flp pilus assembly protein TadG